jgi:DNA repair protein RadC
MSRTFLWEAEQVARLRAPEYLAAQGITSVTADGIVNIALHGGHADQQVKRLAADLLDRAHAEAVRRWAAWYRGVRRITSVSVNEFLAWAESEPGTHHGVTKTKLRKAARRILANARAQSAVA